MRVTQVIACLLFMAPLACRGGDAPPIVDSGVASAMDKDASAGGQAGRGGAGGVNGVAGNDAASGNGASGSGGTDAHAPYDAGMADAGASDAKQGDVSLYADVVRFDYSGENGVPFGSGKPPFAASVGYPAGVPNGYNWKFAANGTPDVSIPLGGRGPQNAGAAYDQIYQHRPGDGSAPNARVLLEPIEAYFFSKSRSQWRKVEQQSVSGAAFAEDFVNNQAVGADSRDEANGAISVRAGSNAAGGVTGRTVEDGPVGFNFHGFDKRFAVDWSDVKAIVVMQVMSCIPNAGTDTSDCDKNPYIANVGLDSWASTTSDFDGFKTHGGVGGGRFKPVTRQRQLFTNYNGPLDLVATDPPPVPDGF